MTITRSGFALVILASTAASPGYLRRTNDMSQARAAHTITVLTDGRAFVAGGFPGSDGEGTAFRTTELFDPATNRFVNGPAMLQGRSGHTASLLPDGRVLLAGGWPDRGEPFGTAEIDDPSGSRAPTPVTLAVARAAQTATTLRDGRVLLVGGVDKDEVELASAEVFDPRTGKSTATGAMSVGRAAHTATLLADGRVVIVGGGEGRYPNMTVHRSIEIYDPATNRFTVRGQLHAARHKHAASLLPDGRVLVLGGSDNRDWRGRYDSAEIFDPATGETIDVGAMSARRFKLGAAVVSIAPGRIVVAGGGDEAEVFNASAARFYRTSGSFGSPLFYSAAALLGDGRILVTGGYSDERNLPAKRSAFVFSTH